MATKLIRQLTQLTGTPDSADVIAITDLSDSATKKITVDDLISYADSDYIQARQDFAYGSLTGAPTALSSFTNDTNYLDSSTVVGVIDSDYIHARAFVEADESFTVDSDGALALAETWLSERRNIHGQHAGNRARAPQLKVRFQPGTYTLSDYFSIEQMDAIVWFMGDSEYAANNTSIELDGNQFMLKGSHVRIEGLRFVNSTDGTAMINVYDNSHLYFNPQGGNAYATVGDPNADNRIQLNASWNSMIQDADGDGSVWNLRGRNTGGVVLFAMYNSSISIVQDIDFHNNGRIETYDGSSVYLTGNVSNQPDNLLQYTRNGTFYIGDSASSTIGSGLAKMTVGENGREVDVSYSGDVNGQIGSINIGSNENTFSVSEGISIGRSIDLNDDYSIGIGRNVTVDGTQSIAIGDSAATGGDDGISIGRHSGKSSTGADNIFIGKRAGRNNSSFENIFIGPDAGNNNSGNENIFVGDDAGLNNTGSNNISLGDDALEGNSGNYSIALGTNAGKNNTGERIIAIGPNAVLENNTTNFAIELSTNDSGGSMYYTPDSDWVFGTAVNAPSFVGDGSGLTGITAGLDSAATIDLIGMQNKSAGNNSIQITPDTSTLNGDNNNIIIGTQISDMAGIGPQAVVMGYDVGGQANGVSIGYQAGAGSQSTNTGGVFIGSRTNYFGNSNPASYAIAIGHEAGAVYPGIGSIALGADAGKGSSGDYTVAIGYKANTTSSFDNTIIIKADGSSAYNSTAQYDIDIRTSDSGSVTYSTDSDWVFGTTVNAPSFVGDGSGLTGISAGADSATVTSIIDSDYVLLHGLQNIADSDNGIVVYNSLKVGDLVISSQDTAAGNVVFRSDSDTNVGIGVSVDSDISSQLEVKGTGITTTHLETTQTVIFNNLPTADPSVAGQLWNDSGTLKISAG